MRRRLSIGIALVGNPAVVLLDEPTSGLDPETRNGIWRVVALAARSRALLLTTHSMDEADALCSRIGILVAGQLRCVGTPLRLKSRFGSGYTLTIALDEEKLSAKSDDSTDYSQNNLSLEAVRARLTSFLQEIVNEQYAAGTAQSQYASSSSSSKAGAKNKNICNTGCVVTLLPSSGSPSILEYNVGKAITGSSSTSETQSLNPQSGSEPNASESDHDGDLRINLGGLFERLERERVETLRATTPSSNSVGSTTNANAQLPIREWGVSKTTLDEVFMRITSQKSG